MYDIKNLGRLRKQAGLTQKQLANLAGVSQSLIAKIESGRIDPAYSKVIKVFTALESLQNKSKKSLTEIMHKQIHSINPNDSVLKAIQLMRKLDISQLPVIDSQSPVGSISETSIIDIISKNQNPKTTKVKDVMQESFPLLPENSNIAILFELLKHCPAVLISKNGKIKGIVTKADLLKAV